MRRGRKVPTVGELKRRKAVERENRAEVGLLGTLFGVRTVRVGSSKGGEAEQGGGTDGGGGDEAEQGVETDGGGDDEAGAGGDGSSQAGTAKGSTS